jgi:hypothetical protein
VILAIIASLLTAMMGKRMQMTVVIKRLPVCLFVLGFCFFIGALLDVGYYHFFGPGLWQPTIHCEHPSQHLGKLSGDKQFPCEFEIKNVGSRPLVIEGVKPSCGSCLKVIGFPKMPIPPGNGDVIRVALLADQLEGSVVKSVAVLSNDPKAPVYILKLYAEIEKHSSEYVKKKSLSKNKLLPKEDDGNQ